MRFVGSDLDLVFDSPLENLDLGLPLGELPEVVDQGLGRGAIDGGDDLFGLAIEGLPRRVTVLGHLGDVAVLSAKDGEGRGDALRDRGHR